MDTVRHQFFKDTILNRVVVRSLSGRDDPAPSPTVIEEEGPAAQAKAMITFEQNFAKQ